MERSVESFYELNKTTLKEYRNLFDKLVAPLSDLQERVIEYTFMNGLLPWISTEVAFCRPKGLAKMMQVAQLVENREIIRGEVNMSGFSGGKYPIQTIANNKSGVIYMVGENKGNTVFPIRTIILRSTNPNENKKEGSCKRLPNSEFQGRKENGLCFRCNEKYSVDHKCKMKE